MSSSGSSWRNLYLSAVREEDPATALNLIKHAFSAIRSRLETLPTGLSDVEEMKEIKLALRHLRSLHKRALQQTEKSYRLTALASTLRRLIGAT
jgi:septation ring formation regulator EzrA